MVYIALSPSIEALCCLRLNIPIARCCISSMELHCSANECVHSFQSADQPYVLHCFEFIAISVASIQVFCSTEILDSLLWTKWYHGIVLQLNILLTSFNFGDRLQLNVIVMSGSLRLTKDISMYFPSAFLSSYALHSAIQTLSSF